LWPTVDNKFKKEDWPLRLKIVKKFLFKKSIQVNWVASKVWCFRFYLGELANQDAK
jgi:hypothetical protein